MTHIMKEHLFSCPKAGGNGIGAEDGSPLTTCEEHLFVRAEKRGGRRGARVSRTDGGTAGRLLAWFVAGAACLAAAACDDDEGGGTSFSVVRSEATFGATESRGYILMSQAGGFTAESSAEWCSTECRADSVVLRAEANKSLEGRTAVVTVTSSSGEAQKVPVTQYGGYFRADSGKVLYAGDGGGLLPYRVESPFDYAVSVAAEWVSCTQTAEGVEFSVLPNVSGQPRRAHAWIWCEAMARRDTVELRQYGAEDFVGRWTATFVNRRGETAVREAEVRASGSGFAVSGLYEGVTVYAVRTGNTLGIRTGQDLGLHDSGGSRFRFRLSGVDEAGKVHAEDGSGTRVYVCSPEWDDGESSSSCSFAGDSAFTDGSAMAGVAVYAYTPAGEERGVVEMFRHLKLERR